MNERETITCKNPKCRLVQFKTEAQVCRRCKLSTADPVPEQVVEVSFVLPTGHSVDLMRATSVTISARRGTMSQRMLALKMGCPRTYISKVEGGKAMPVLTSLDSFARAFRIPLWVLVKEIETSQAILAAAENEMEK